jgi:hypothetical protein
VSMTRRSSVRAGLAQRARIVLLAADGVSNTAIADKVGVSRQTVISWRERYAGRGIGGLHDEPRSWRPRVVDHRAIVADEADLVLVRALSRPSRVFDDGVVARRCAYASEGMEQRRTSESGAGYDLKVRIEDRDSFFSSDWTDIVLDIPGQGSTRIALSDSFWRSCSELRSSAIGR